MAKPRTGPGTEHEEQDRADQGRHVAVDDRGESLVEADIQRLHGAGTGRRFLADTGVDQNIGIHRHADTENDTRDAGKRQRRAQHTKHGDRQDRVQDETDIGDDAPGCVEHQHHHNDEGKAGKTGIDTHADGVGAEVRGRRNVLR